MHLLATGYNESCGYFNPDYGGIRGICESQNQMVCEILPDFTQTSTEVTTIQLPALPSPSITIVIQGNGVASNPTRESSLPVNQGEVFFTAVNQTVTMEISSESMLLFQAYAAV